MDIQILKAALFTPVRDGKWGLPLLAWGTVGIGKTALIEATAARYGLPCETLSPGERGEGAFGVIPVPSSNVESGVYLSQLAERVAFYTTKEKAKPDEALCWALRDVPRAEMVLTYPRPEWTNKFEAAGRGVVFIDEIGSVPPAMQPPLMGLLLARRIGGYTLPKGVRMLAAANPIDIACGGYDLTAPVANRLGHINWTSPTVDEHTQFMLSGSSGHGALQALLAEMDEDAGRKPAVPVKVDETIYNAEGEEARVLKAWPLAWAKAVALETSFLRVRPSHKNMVPNGNDPKSSRAFATDRSWDAATHAYASALVHNLSESERETFIAAFIGEGVANEWFAFIEQQDLPDPAAVLDGKTKFKHDDSRLDRTFATLQACVGLVLPETAAKRPARAVALWDLISKIITDHKSAIDITVPATEALVKATLHIYPASFPVLNKIAPMLVAANVTPGSDR